MKFFKWIEGRQENCVYHKWCFLYTKIGRFGFDGYILRYQPRTELPPHTDRLKGKHWRLNLSLKGESLFMCQKNIFSIPNFLYIFRPDKYIHSLYVGTKTYKLSLGFAILNRKQQQ